MTSNDFAIFPEGAGIKGFRSGQDAFEFVTDLFNAYYKLGKAEYPQALTYGIHPMRSCIPDRIGIHERVFEYMLKFKDIWWARYIDMARHWMKNFMDA